jgi:uncharacterized protein (TIRG00374 family)
MSVRRLPDSVPISARGSGELAPEDGARPRLSRSAILMAARVAVQLSAAGGLLAVFVWRVNPGRLLGDLGTADWRWVAAAVPLIALARIAHGVRWWLLVRRAGKVPLVDTVLVLLAAAAATALLPLRAGAAVQVQVLGRRWGIDRTAVAGTLMADGMLDALAFLLLGLLAVPLLNLSRDVALLALGVATGAALLTGAVMALARPEVEAKWLHLVPKGERSLVEHAVEGVARGFAAFSQGRSVALVLLMMVADWVVAVAAYWCLGQAFDLTVSPFAFFGVEVVARFVAAFSLSQSDLGTYELAVSETLSTVGADLGRAGAFALGAHASLMLVTMLMSIAAIFALRLSWRDLVYVHDHHSKGGAM